MQDYDERIRALEAEIAVLPSGYISKKNIRGNIKNYYQWNEDRKKKSRYLDERAAEEMETLILKRRDLQKELREVRRLQQEHKGIRSIGRHVFKTGLLLGDSLRSFAEQVREYRHRDCFIELSNYLRRKVNGKVFILFGLRRTGKTTLIKQAVLSLSDAEFERTAFIQVTHGNTLGDINEDLQWLSTNGYKYVFVDEVTLADDFIEGAALLSDIYAASGMKLVLSGTDSLGFVFSESEELYDRCIMLHTTFISYSEFERVLGINGIDEYIRYGGTMSLGGVHYNEPVTFRDKASTDEYIDSAIARNIQHSLRCYQDSGHFRHLAELFEHNELTSAINRVVEDINHRFTMNILDRIDESSFTERLRRMLEILNKNEQKIMIGDAHRLEIKEYLDLLDLTVDIQSKTIAVKNNDLLRTVIAQPGLRYAQAEALIRQLLKDDHFNDISANDRAYVLERIMNEIKGRMMEDIVLLETLKANPDKEVFRLQFAVGEFDMVIADPASITCEIYEIKYSKETVPDQYRHLISSEKCAETAFRFGKITRKAVIYRGENKSVENVEYINVEDYLKNLHVRMDHDSETDICDTELRVNDISDRNCFVVNADTEYGILIAEFNKLDKSQRDRVMGYMAALSAMNEQQ
ncbi:MAG: AAA family ATPase [Lachnospiraceae bacterium]|nr:AAA family ATPase [Lachnospiraceae bacterium]